MNKKKYYSIFNNRFFYLLLLIPIFEPDIFKSFSATDNLFIILKFIVLIILGIRYFTLKKCGRFSLYTTLYCAGLILVTVVNNQDLFFVIKKTIECILVSMLLEIGFYYNGTLTCKWIFNYLFFLVLIDLILFIIFPKGLLEANMNSTNYKMYFLGIKNGMINWMVLGAILGLVYYTSSANTKFLKKIYFFFFLAMISILFTGSTTGILTFTIFLAYYFCSKFFKFRLSLGRVIPILVLMYLAIIVFRVQNYIPKVFFDLFGKDTSFSGRDNLWNFAWLYFRQRPIFGNGLREISLINFYGRSFSAHNFILELLMDGGVFQFSLFIIILVVLILKIRKCKYQVLKNHLTMSFILFFITSLVGANIYAYHWFAVWTIIYTSELFDQEIRNKVQYLNIYEKK